MAVCSSLSLNLAPNVTSQARVYVSHHRNSTSFDASLFTNSSSRRIGFTRLYADLTQIEPDLNEDPVDRWATYGIDQVRHCFELL